MDFLENIMLSGLMGKIECCKNIHTKEMIQVEVLF